MDKSNGVKIAVITGLFAIIVALINHFSSDRSEKPASVPSVQGNNNFITQGNNNQIEHTSNVTNISNANSRINFFPINLSKYLELGKNIDLIKNILGPPDNEDIEFWDDDTKSLKARISVWRFEDGSLEITSIQEIGEIIGFDIDINCEYDPLKNKNPFTVRNEELEELNDISDFVSYNRTLRFGNLPMLGKATLRDFIRINPILRQIELFKNGEYEYKLNDANIIITNKFSQQKLIQGKCYVFLTQYDTLQQEYQECDLSFEPCLNTEKAEDMLLKSIDTHYSDEYIERHFKHLFPN